MEIQKCLPQTFCDETFILHMTSACQNDFNCTSSQYKMVVCPKNTNA